MCTDAVRIGRPIKPYFCYQYTSGLPLPIALIYIAWLHTASLWMKWTLPSSALHVNEKTTHTTSRISGAINDMRSSYRCIAAIVDEQRCKQYHWIYPNWPNIMWHISDTSHYVRGKMWYYSLTQIHFVFAEYFDRTRMADDNYLIVMYVALLDAWMGIIVATYYALAATLRSYVLYIPLRRVCMYIIH
jgi:hypothetical protein